MFRHVCELRLCVQIIYMKLYLQNYVNHLCGRLSHFKFILMFTLESKIYLVLAYVKG